MSDGVSISEIFSSIQGEGYLAGRRQVFIRLMGCNLDCRYCDTIQEAGSGCRVETRPGSGSFDLLPHSLPLTRVLDILADWLTALPGAHHSISLTGGEPLLCADALTPWLPRLRGLLPIHLETNGTLHQALEQVIGHCDYIGMDMKLPSTSGCGDDLWEPHRLFLRAAAARNVSVKVVVGAETNDGEVRRVCDIIASVDRSIPLFLQPLSLAGGAVGIGAAHILRLQGVAAAMLPDVRVIPQMHKLLGVL